METKIQNKFETELSYIKNERIRKSGKVLVDLLPDYFFKVPASSTGKYHPKYTTGEYGLYKHVKAAVRIAKELLILEMYQNIFTETEIDLIYLAIILHDGLKKGINEEKYTRFDHPILMADYIMDNKDKIDLTDNELEILTGAIKTHMGQWIYDFKGDKVLDKPTNKVQKFVHLCDFLASRKILNVEFDSDLQIID
ncbi:MAG: hypothetical protein E7158_06280 [Firmicutes bacterium]|nr:hypothetical protein [Bacillota bacterium]